MKKIETMLKTVVIDDEPLARSRIKELLLTDPEVLLAGEARNGGEANRIISSINPDLVFLDIQMPDYDGFSVLSKLNPDMQPVIIFVTAYDQFAIRAFETNAIDYLLKPFDNQRFAKALFSAKKQAKLKQFSKLSQDLLDLVKSYQWEQQAHPETIPIKQQGITREIPIEQIISIQSQGNYVKLSLLSKWYLYRTTISHLAEKFQKYNFLRIHRSLMVNTAFVVKVCYRHNNEYDFVLTNGNEFTSSRSYKSSIDAFALSRANHS